MSTPQELISLVERFSRFQDDYHHNRFNETQLRIDYLNPLFRLLGWDMDNRQGRSETFREVIHEYHLQTPDGSKAPDYGFRIGKDLKFFLEAKKPSVKIKDDHTPAFQLRSYAWNAKLPLSILSDFEEFAIYDCRFMPDRLDRATVARLDYVTFDQLPQKWEWLYGTFSKQAIENGAFDKYAEITKSKHGTIDVDDAFLAEIEQWREWLAVDIARRNPTITVGELNDAVQRTIDRIIFLRIAEDRGIEEFGQLQKLAQGERIYPQLVQLFRQADNRYNSGLFHFRKEKGQIEEPDNLTPDLKIDDKLLKEIFRRLYYPSPYRFIIMPASVLGQVYEQFLGKVITLDSKHHATVELKPEVRKAGGVYYTPDYIARYIVQNTIGRLVEGKTPKDVAKLRFLDPACGSGSFLLAAYEFLLDWHLNWYSTNDSIKWSKGKDAPLCMHHVVDNGGLKEKWQLMVREKRRILLNNIYGVDIDRQAVEVTKLSLLLKVLEGESTETLGRQMALLHERVLPDLGNNIKCGNSLIGSDFSCSIANFDIETMKRINPFDWVDEFPAIIRRGGFDAVIGNPPYDVMEKERGASSWPHSALAEYIKTHSFYGPATGGKLNLFRFFMVRAVHLLKQGGTFGMIVPLSVIADISTARTRHYLIHQLQPLYSDCFPQKDNPRKRIFLRAKLSTTILTGIRKEMNTHSDPSIRMRVYPANSFNDAHSELVASFSDVALLDPAKIPIPLADEPQWRLCIRIHSHGSVKRLEEIDDFSVTRGEINQSVYRKYITTDLSHTRLLKGAEIGPYQIRARMSQGTREAFNEREYLNSNKHKMISGVRRIATQRITGVDERLRLVATIIDPLTYFADSTNSITVSNTSMYDLCYLLGLLNSQLFQWRFKLTSTNNNVGTNELDSMPFRLLDFKSTKECASHDRMVSLVTTMLSLNKQCATAKSSYECDSLKRIIGQTSRQIDQLVYELYELTEEEIALVEGEIK